MDATAPAQILKSIYARRAKANPQYSMRAFARDLKLSPSFFTNFLKGRRRLSVERAEGLVKLLELDRKTASRFVKSVLLENLEAKAPGAKFEDLLNEKPSQTQSDVSLDEFQFFNNWYHVAILDLVGCADFEASSSWIAGRLGLSPEIAFATVDRLKRLGLLKVKNGRLVKANAHLRVPTSSNGNNIVINYHRQMIDKALAELSVTDEKARERRLITGITMSIPAEKMELAKRKVAEFKQEMSALLTSGPADEVVQLNIQLFPLTKPKA